jgi:hypothetical protein
MADWRGAVPAEAPEGLGMAERRGAAQTDAEGLGVADRRRAED